MRDPIASKLYAAVRDLVMRYGDPCAYMFSCAAGRLKEAPFSDDHLQEGRSRIANIVGSSDLPDIMTIAEGQPFFLKLASELGRVLGDPDW